ncbi:MAG: VOC family protein [Acidimicrobiales bacterium]
MSEAVAFCQAAGFTVRSYDAGFAFVHFNEVSVFDLGLEVGLDPSFNRAGCYIIVPDVDAWHRRLSTASLSVTPVEEQPWGMREFTLTDPSGNRLRIGHSTS